MNFIYSIGHLEKELRVVKRDAVLRLMPDKESLEIKILPIGSIFSIVEISEDWIKIKLPPNQVGIIITGYIHRSEVQMGDKQNIERAKVRIHLKDGSILQGNIIEEDEK